MAIILSTEKIVRSFRPENGTTFTIDELNDLVGGWIEPFKVGPVWVMQKEKSAKNSLYNELASMFFEVALYGEVLVVPPQQLPREWDLMEYEDQFITAEMVDNGMLISLQNALALKKLQQENPSWNINPIEFFNSQFNFTPKEEYNYDPPTDEFQIDEGTAEFLEKVYNYITSAPLQFRNGVLLDESRVIVRTKKENLKTVLQIIKGMYLESEQYEKCAALQQLEDQCY
jgi:hypothetical protein